MGRPLCWHGRRDVQDEMWVGPMAVGAHPQVSEVRARAPHSRERFAIEAVAASRRHQVRRVRRSRVSWLIPSI